MEGNALYLETLVEQGIVDGRLHTLQFFGIAAVFRIDGGFIDREVQKRTPGDATHLDIFSLWQHIRQPGDFLQTGVIDNRSNGTCHFLLPAQQKGGTYFQIAAHVRRSTCLDSIELVGEEGMAQFHTYTPVITEPVGGMKTGTNCRDDAVVCVVGGSIGESLVLGIGKGIGQTQTCKCFQVELLSPLFRTCKGIG